MSVRLWEGHTKVQIRVCGAALWLGNKVEEERKQRKLREVVGVRVHSVCQVPILVQTVSVVLRVQQ